MLKTIQKRKFNPQENFSKKSCDSKVIDDALKALREIQQEAQRNGTSEMTLEEINLEIFLTRREMEARRKK